MQLWSKHPRTHHNYFLLRARHATTVWCYPKWQMAQKGKGSIGLWIQVYFSPNTYNALWTWSLLPPLFPVAGAAAAALPHFLTAAAGMFASPLLDIAADALSDPETVPPLTLRTICSPAWSGPYLVLLRRQSQQHASHCLFCHPSTLSYSAEVQPSDIEMGPLWHLWKIRDNTLSLLKLCCPRLPLFRNRTEVAK